MGTGSQHPYSSGIYPAQSPPGYSPYLQPNDETDQGSIGDDPSFESNAYLEMSSAWLPIDLCVNGTEFFRVNARTFLPQEPAELDDAWERRVSHATVTPFTVRIAEQAAGLILRKGILLSSKQQDADVDSYWEEFAESVDGRGTSLAAFARRVVVSSVLYGHAGTLVDYPTREPAPSLQAERLAGMRPYFSLVDCKQIIGWRFDQEDPLAPVQQVRINEYVSVPFGEFGEKTVRQIRVLEAGSYRVYRRNSDSEATASESDGWYIHEQGQISLPVIPLAITYSQKVTDMISVPPLLSIANLNISHAQRNADLQHSLHVSAMPIMVIKGFDDTVDPVGLSVNNAILLPPEGDCFMVEPASQSFQAQQDYLDRLEEQMASLGMSTLFAQKQGAETAESKRLSRTDSDSLLSVISNDLESMLQNAFEMAAAYVGKEAPLVQLDRDFDLQLLDGNQVGQYMQLWMNNAITLDTLLNMLKKGEVLPDLDVQEEVELVQQEALDSMLLQAVPGEAAAPSDEGGRSQNDEDVRGAAVERMQRMTRRPNDDEDEE